MKRCVLAFSGKIGSGKSTASKGVANALGVGRVAFGDYVREVARTRGLPETGETLQNLGASLVEENIRSFCVGVLELAGRPDDSLLVVDGLRHAEVATTLRAVLAPAHLRIIYIDTPDNVRAMRLKERGRVLNRLENHSTEIQVETAIRNLADLVVDGSNPPHTVVTNIVDWVEADLRKH